MAGGGCAGGVGVVLGGWRVGRPAIGCRLSCWRRGAEAPPPASGGCVVGAAERRGVVGAGWALHRTLVSVSAALAPLDGRGVGVARRSRGAEPDTVGGRSEEMRFGVFGDCRRRAAVVAMTATPPSDAPRNGVSGRRASSGACESHESGPITSRIRPSEMFTNARTRRGSNCVPAQRASSARASVGWPTPCTTAPR